MTGVGNVTDVVITDTDTPLDGNETVEVRLDREELYLLMLAAHERDITLNQLVEEILRQYIKEHKEWKFLRANTEIIGLAHIVF